MPHVLILRAPGTNCDLETAYAFQQAGATTERLHINRLLEEPGLFKRFQILCFPGGFSYGDDVASGRILANQMQHHLSEELMAFRDAGKLVLGICNGFQVLIKTGLLLNDVPGEEPSATLAWNNCGCFQDRWVRLVTCPRSHNVFLRGIEEMYIPMAHAEGRFAARDLETLKKLDTSGQLALRYAPLQRSPWDKESEQDAYNAHGILQFPDNPNGAMANTAGVSDLTGRVLGLMPHPERHITPTQHPQWTRRSTQPKEGDGMKIFHNAVEFFK